MIEILVSIDEDLLARIDKEAEREGLSRSAYVSRLVGREFGAREGPGRAAQVRRALDRLDRLFAHHRDDEDSTKSIRREAS